MLPTRSKVNSRKLEQWAVADLSITLLLDSATMHPPKNLVSYHHHSNTSWVILSDPKVRDQTSSTPSVLAETTWRESLSKTLRSMETVTSQAQVDIAQTRDSNRMEELIPWHKDYLTISLHSIRARSCQVLDSICIQRSQERISSNLRSELRVNTLSPRQMTDLWSQLRKLQLQHQMCIVLWITWTKTSTQPSRRLSKLPLAKISRA